MQWVTPVSDCRRRASTAALAALVAIFLACGAPTQAQSQDKAERLSRLVHGLPWQGVSSPIGFRGRLWFVNSVKFVNHNSADLYSFDPKSGQARYEKYLFSQDAGEPVLSDGLLYWPFEDTRFSPGHSEFMVTNGRDWNWGVIPKGHAFHTHAMAVFKDGLVAALSAWFAQLAVSKDKGATWSLAYEYPTPERRVCRITTLASLNGKIFSGVTTWYDNTDPNFCRWERTASPYFVLTVSQWEQYLDQKVQSTISPWGSVRCGRSPLGADRVSYGAAPMEKPELTFNASILGDLCPAPCSAANRMSVY